MNILAEMLLTEPAPMAIWGSLMVLTTPALVVLANPDGVRNPGQTLVDTATFVSRYRKRRQARQARREAAKAQTVRYAEEVRVAATQATEAVNRWQTHWQEASTRVDEAWTAWQTAEARQARSRSAAAFGTPRTPQSPAEYADRERFLHRELRAAAARGDLPLSAARGDLLPYAAQGDLPLPAAQGDLLPSEVEETFTATHLQGQGQGPTLTPRPENAQPCKEDGVVRAVDAALRGEDVLPGNGDDFLTGRGGGVQANSGGDALVGRGGDVWVNRGGDALAGSGGGARVGRGGGALACNGEDALTRNVGDALAGSAGWDATLHPVEQEMVLHRAYAAHREREYTAAVAAEQAAWHDLQLARRSRDSLLREADRAVQESTTGPETRKATLPARLTHPGRRALIREVDLAL
ncbi:hypothetical protein [Actinoplanes couchii]|uniref:Uncharacterized protein n=1 Tax=Actinoplanes couchii TaxID=403638 RepID=A0ABQ3XB84_9ACTN|nr:hypothetical protein [Actinoplanes couchii]MDR6323224.1 hypothetical protein [Actinoplanes couchii]GID55739.1 hypothetical protein Aco03nite_041430 [Actinoplanes couchii]